MTDRIGSDRKRPPFQLRLRTIIVVIVATALLLGILRPIGPNLPLKLALLFSVLLGAAVGSFFRRWLRGAIVGGITPILYVLSIEVAAHVGHRAAWPPGTLRWWDIYSSLWYKQPFGSPRAVFFWMERSRKMGLALARDERCLSHFSGLIPTIWSNENRSNLWNAYWVWVTFCDVLRTQFGTDTPTFVQFSLILLAVTAVLVITARKIHPALLLPVVAAVADIALVIGKDFDATFFGLACGLILAIPLAGSARRKRDPENKPADLAQSSDIQ